MKMRTLTALVALLVPALSAFAQPLADRVPDDALIYVAWRGSASLGPGFEQSHLKALLDNSNLREVFDEFLPAVMKRLGEEEPDAAAVAGMGSDLGEAVWKYPTAFFFAGIDWEGANGPAPRAGILIQAGKDSARLQKQIAGLLEQAKEQGEIPFEVKAVVAGDLVAVAAGYDAARFRPAKAAGAAGGAAGAKAAPGRSLRTAARFKAALAQVNKDPVAVAYVDAKGIQALADQVLAKMDDAEATAMWGKARDALGLEGLQQIIYTGGFANKGWEDHLFVAAPAPRQGLMSMLDAEPVSDGTLKLIPKTATMAAAVSFDFGKLLDEARAAAVKVDPGAGEQFDEAMKQVGGMIGMDVREDLLAAFGNEWALYGDRNVGGEGFLGLVAVNRLKDAEKARASLGKLIEQANAVVAEQLKGEEVQVSVRTAEVNGLEIQYLATPFITPAWAFKDGNLYVGMYPQTVAAAAAYAETGGGSILENEGFNALREALGGARATSFQYVDLPRTAPFAYPTWLAISRVAGVGDLFGVPSPPMILPTLPQMMRHLAPAGAVTYADKGGWHARSTSPFPGSTLLASDPLSSYSTAAAPLAISVLLPSLNRAREQAKRVASASNLRQIGLGAMMYANENKGRYPGSLGEIIKTQDLTAPVFVSPRTTAPAPPAQFTGPEEAAEWVEANSSYVWVGKGLKTTADSDTVLAYEKPEGLTDGINVLFADGHVEFLTMDDAMRRIEGGRDGEGDAGGGGARANPLEAPSGSGVGSAPDSAPPAPGEEGDDEFEPAVGRAPADRAGGSSRVNPDGPRQPE